MCWVVKATALPALPLGMRLFTHCIGGWLGPRASLDGRGKPCPFWIQSPERPARSKSLYELSHPGPDTVELHYYFSQLLASKRK